MYLQQKALATLNQHRNEILSEHMAGNERTEDSAEPLVQTSDTNDETENSGSETKEEEEIDLIE